MDGERKNVWKDVGKGRKENGKMEGGKTGKREKAVREEMAKGKRMMRLQEGRKEGNTNNGK